MTFIFSCPSDHVTSWDGRPGTAPKTVVCSQCSAEATRDLGKEGMQWAFKAYADPHNEIRDRNRAFLASEEAQVAIKTGALVHEDFAKSDQGVVDGAEAMGYGGQISSSIIESSKASVAMADEVRRPIEEVKRFDERKASGAETQTLGSDEFDPGSLVMHDGLLN